MSDSYLNRLPAHEQEKIRKRLRSPEEYERLREKVKGPEELERELKRAEQLAELSFSLESDPAAQERVKASLERAIREQGLEQVVDGEVSPDVQRQLEQGKFRVTIGEHPTSHSDHVVLVVEGNVAEALPLNSSFNEKAISPLGSQKN